MGRCAPCFLFSFFFTPNFKTTLLAPKCIRKGIIFAIIHFTKLEMSFLGIYSPPLGFLLASEPFANLEDLIYGLADLDVDLSLV